MTKETLKATDETTIVGLFDRSRAPVLTIDSGDEVNIETNTHWGDAITPETTIEDIIELRTEKFPNVGPHTLTGPVEIRGAEPGMTLKVEVQKLVPREHGFNLFYPGTFGTGLLPEDFEEGRIHHFTHDLENRITRFKEGVTIPLQPFLGIMGVAPATEEPLSTVPPGPHGGNMDLPELTDGGVAYLPIFTSGAMFSIGDAHSKQGHGEVCLTAIETAFLESHLRFTVLEDWPLDLPSAETDEYWITMGFNSDLLEASRSAIRQMITFLEARFGLDRGEAYSLCSIAADLSVTQVVNITRGVHARLPKALFQ